MAKTKYKFDYNTYYGSLTMFLVSGDKKYVLEAGEFEKIINTISLEVAPKTTGQKYERVKLCQKRK